MTRTPLWTAALLLACGCGSVTQTDDASPAIDAAAHGGPPPSAELPPASGRVSGGTYTLDVEVGLPFSQGPSVGGGYLIQASTTVKP